jgi:CBS domain-containing protein
MKIRDILSSKGHHVVTVAPDQTVLTAARTLAQHDIGAVVVRTPAEILGILSERDILKLVAADPSGVESTLIADAMTSNLIVGVPTDDIDYVMNIMTQNRIRHLPIVHDGDLAGMVSIGDVVNALRREVESENRHLKDYIQGVAR